MGENNTPTALKGCGVKTEFIVFGSKAQCLKISSRFPASILGSLLHPVDSVRNLGVWFDADFSFSEHIKRTSKACFLQMRDLCRIRKYLTSEVAVLAANALFSSHLDYCNSLFRFVRFQSAQIAKYSEHPCSYCYKS